MAEIHTGRKYYPALDGLRGFAMILALVAHHFEVIPYFPMLGFYGLDIFFVLSGFLITDILIRSKEKQGWLTNFFRNRVLRVFPVYYLVLVLYFIFGPLFNPEIVQYNYYAEHWPMLVFHLNNFLNVFYPNLTDGRIFSHFWSLSLEEQFYLCWPFLIVLLSKRKLLIPFLLLLMCASIAGRLYVWHQYRHDELFYWGAMVNIRFDCIAAGVLLALFRYSYPGSWKKKYFLLSAAIFIIYAVCVCYKYLGDRSFPHYLVGGVSAFCASVGLTIIYCTTEAAQRSWFVFKPLIFFGKISYGLYVYHFPIYLISKHYAISNFGDSLKVHLLTGSVTLIIAILVATASYSWFEKRFLALKK